MGCLYNGAMNVNVRETHDVNFFPKFEASDEVIAAMSMAVIKTEGYYDALLRQVQRQGEQSISRIDSSEM